MPISSKLRPPVISTPSAFQYRFGLISAGIILSAVGIFTAVVMFLTRTVDPSQYSGCTPLTADGEVDPAQTVAIWQEHPLLPPLALRETLSDKERNVLGVSTEEKWIEVDLSDQKLIAHQGDKVFVESAISSGLWNKTPIGEYRIWYKIRSTKMEGGSRLNNTYYYLPNVPYSMFFNGDYGIHGTYWHNNFGKPMSHGCVNTPTPIAEKLFYWTDPQLPTGKKIVRANTENPGTRVVVHD